jgi:hypothetical protein
MAPQVVLPRPLQTGGVGAVASVRASLVIPSASRL